jgi:hypothetical protein
MLAKAFFMQASEFINNGKFWTGVISRLRNVEMYRHCVSGD